jgi:mono/diheme cytochrome c family protein
VDDAAPGEQLVANPAETSVTLTGSQLYSRHCAACHGENGNGLGLAAQYVFPKPRNLRTGAFRLVSTDNNVPSRQDLEAVLLRGMPGSSMPPWGHLSKEQRNLLIDEILRLRYEGFAEQYVVMLKEQEDMTEEEIAQDEDSQQAIREYATEYITPGEPNVVPEMSPSDDKQIALGREVYATAGCAACHGKEGRGDTTQKMVDEIGLPNKARDFTAGVFKGSDDPRSLYLRIAYGLPGSAMPSSKQLNSEQMVALVHFIRSLSTEAQRQAVVLNREKIVAAAVAKLPSSPDESAWSDVAAAQIRMMPLWWRDNSDPDLRVQVVHDGKSLAVRLSWRDETPNPHSAKMEAFKDAVAMELYHGANEPFIGMGAPKSAVDVWFWDADRQQFVDLSDQYPRTVVDIYPLSEQQVAVAEFDREGTKLANQPDYSLPAVAAGNQISRHPATSGASNLTGNGPGSTTFRMPRSQHVVARGTWNDGRWSVLMTRPLKLSSPSDGVMLAAGDTLSAAFAVWDGSQSDRDGKKLISIWQDFVLDK